MLPSCTAFKVKTSRLSRRCLPCSETAALNFITDQLAISSRWLYLGHCDSLS